MDHTLVTRVKSISFSHCECQFSEISRSNSMEPFGSVLFSRLNGGRRSIRWRLFSDLHDLGREFHQLDRFLGVPKYHRFSGWKSHRQPAEVAQTTGCNCLFFMMSVAAPARARKSPFGATVNPTDRSSAAAKSAAKLVALGRLPRLRS